jgi:hypothetical protein
MRVKRPKKEQLCCESAQIVTSATAWTYNSANLPATIQYPANNQDGLGEIVTIKVNYLGSSTNILL